jgi:hypothetical protein
MRRSASVASGRSPRPRPVRVIAPEGASVPDLLAYMLQQVLQHFSGRKADRIRHTMKLPILPWKEFNALSTGRVGGRGFRRGRDIELRFCVSRLREQKLRRRRRFLMFALFWIALYGFWIRHRCRSTQRRRVGHSNDPLL